MLVYEYKLDGTSAQYARIDEAIRVVQFVRNTCLRKWMDEHGINANDLQVFCAVLAKDFAFAAALNSQARQASADRAWFAISRFYANCTAKKPGQKGYPRFQHDNRSVEYKVTGWKLDPDGKHLSFTDGCGIGRLRMVGTRDITTFPLAQIKRVRLMRRADGYYVQFCVDAERHVAHVPTGRQAGIDLGLKEFYTDSDGQVVHNPRFLRKAERRIKYLQRRVSRTSKKTKNEKQGKDTHKSRQNQRRARFTRQPTAEPPPKEPVTAQSHNYQQARQQLAKAYLKVQRQREDFARKQASALISSHDLVAYEDLQIRNLVKNHHLAKSIQDAAWARFLWWVVYYARLHGIPCIAVPPQYTSQECSGTLLDGSACRNLVPKSLSVRTHYCGKCALQMDRDHNSGRVILERGRALYRSTVGQTGTGSP